jgi:lysophospholipase L1-like esterase
MRWDVWDVAQQTNLLINEYSSSQDKLFVIDVGADLLGSDGKPNSDLYRLDGLHLNENGYAHWSKAILSRMLADLYGTK